MRYVPVVFFVFLALFPIRRTPAEIVKIPPPLHVLEAETENKVDGDTSCEIHNGAYDPLLYWDGFNLGTGLAVYMNPTQCSVYPYPFTVTNVRFYLYGETRPPYWDHFHWPVAIRVNIRGSSEGDNCSEPQDILASEDFIIPSDSGYPRMMTLSLDSVCRVYQPFFVEIVYTESSDSLNLNPSLLMDTLYGSPYVVCDNWVVDSDGHYHEWHDFWSSLYPDYPPPGNPIVRAIGKAGCGAVLIHGYTGSNESWGNLGGILEDKEKKVKFFSHQGTDIPIETLAVRLKDSLEVWGEELAIEERGVDLIGHSMGGLIARYYVSHYTNNVNKLITLAMPHYGTYAANQAGQFPFSFFPVNNVQAREQALGSQFLWNLHHEWITYQNSPSQKPDVLTIVATRDGGPHSWCWLYPLLYICPYSNDNDDCDDIDGLVAVNSASLENFGTPVYYVPRNHAGPNGLAYIADETHPSYNPIISFLCGITPVTPAEDDIGDPNHPIHYSFIGNFLLGLRDPSGNPIEVEHVNWPPGIRGNNWGRNPYSGLYFASMVQPGSHNIVVDPNVVGYSPIPATVTINPHQTNVYEFTVYPADASATNNFACGDTDPQVFGVNGKNVLVFCC